MLVAVNIGGQCAQEEQGIRTGTTYLVLDHPVRIILGHVAARGDGLIVRSLVSVCDRRPIKIIDQRGICVVSVHAVGTDGKLRLEWLQTLALPLDAVALLKETASGFLGLFWFASMPWGRGRGDGARNKVEYGPQALEDIVLAGKLAGVLKRQIGACVAGGERSACAATSAKSDGWSTLKFAVASLDLLVVALLDVALKNAGPGGLVEGCGLQDMSGIYPVVGLTAHDMFSLAVDPRELELPYWILSGRWSMSADVGGLRSVTPRAITKTD